MTARRTVDGLTCGIGTQRELEDDLGSIYDLEKVLLGSSWISNKVSSGQVYS